MKMGVFINSGNGYQPVKVADKIDFVEPPKTGSNVKPANKAEMNIQLSKADDDFEFIKSLVPDEEEIRKKVHSLLQAAGGRIKDGERKIIECPNCGHKVYALREGGILRVSCGGCHIDASAKYLSELKINIPKSHI